MKGRKMFIQVNQTTWLNPKLARIALGLNLTEPDRRELWVVSTARTDVGIEVDRQFQETLLKAMGVDLGELARMID
jgi:hypothetical protein